MGGCSLLKNCGGSKFGFCLNKDNFGRNFRHIKGLSNASIPTTANCYYAVSKVPSIAEGTVEDPISMQRFLTGDPQLFMSRTASDNHDIGCIALHIGAAHPTTT